MDGIPDFWRSPRTASQEKDRTGPLPEGLSLKKKRKQMTHVEIFDQGTART